MYLDRLLKLPHYGAGFFEVTLIIDAKIGDWDFEESMMKNTRKNTNKVERPIELLLGISEKGAFLADRSTRVTHTIP